MTAHLPLTAEAVSALETRGCTCLDWSRVRVSAGFDPARVRNVHFQGDIRLGSLAGSPEVEEGVPLTAGLSDATIVDCEIGDDVRISNVGCLARYRVEDGAVVTGVGSAVTRPGARFGNGVEASPVNEGGGREVTLYAEMSSQYAYLMAMHRHGEGLVEGLRRIAEGYAEGAACDRGRIGAGARVDQVGRMIDVNVGPAAQVLGAERLGNGTILSEPEAPARVGAGVCAEDFIIAEGAEVEDGVVLHTAFVGQGVQLGKQFSAENSLFFANCEGFHGEACSIFAGPYTVTHHKSTLLIAGIYSFYNAGSGTNQSNHMYKLGPVHQGVIQRGTKNGSFSYMRWPTVVGPFCVIIGKHLNNFDIGDLPFSYVTEEDGESLCTPAMNMFTVGTVRDGDKWPTRDRREGTTKRDQIRFEVYSPYTVGKMLRGEALLKELYEGTSREVELVRHKGVVIKRLLLRRSARNYADGIDAYLRGRVLERASEARRAGDAEALRQVLASGDGVHSADWTDVGGLLMPRERLRRIEAAVAGGELDSPAALDAAFAEAAAAYEADEWEWVRAVWRDRTGTSAEDLTPACLDQIEADHRKAAASFVRRILADAEKEFDPIARFGYGLEGGETERDRDFAAVRGGFDDNSFVRQMRDQLDAG
ncbi:MAG: DUF4954 family protein [Gemmatimonadaceae bacterium]|nr:DUF4954 family protein [Gemmatimonadaceae bacterium]